jgi:hypothetical protein
MHPLAFGSVAPPTAGTFTTAELVAFCVLTKTHSFLLELGAELAGNPCSLKNKLHRYCAIAYN